MSKSFVFSVLVLLLLFSGMYFFVNEKSSVKYDYEMTFIPIIKKKPEIKAATLVFGGDVMLSRSIGIHMKKNDNYHMYWEPLYELIKDSDLSFVNLESPISDKGANVGSIYSFRASPLVMDGVIESGLDVVSFANNHVWDWGRLAFLDTLDRLDNAGIIYAGAGMDSGESHMPKIISANGIEIAYLAYTDLVSEWLRRDDAEPSIAGIEMEKIIEDIDYAKELGADFVVVSYHFGEEYKTSHNSYQEKIAKETIDAGANFVIGHHPHVAEGIELYKGGVIAYSLGNLIFDQNFSPETSFGLMLKAKVSKDEILSLEKIRIDFNSTFVPKIGTIDEII